jgi:hypothetical protein
MTAPYAAPTPPAPPRPTRTRAGTVTVFVLIGVVLICLGLGTTGYLLVVKVAPGAKQPTAAASGLLGAIFVEQDEKAADRYVCARQRDAKAVQQLLDEAAQYQQAGSKVTWSDLTQTTRHGDEATVTAELHLRRTVDGQPRTDDQKWRFGVTDERGWRVCAISTGR